MAEEEQITLTRAEYEYLQNRSAAYGQLAHGLQRYEPPKAEDPTIVAKYLDCLEENVRLKLIMIADVQGGNFLLVNIKKQVIETLVEKISDTLNSWNYDDDFLKEMFDNLVILPRDEEKKQPAATDSESDKQKELALDEAMRSALARARGL